MLQQLEYQGNNLKELKKPGNKREIRTKINIFLVHY
jgi:hypothetical protein